MCGLICVIDTRRIPRYSHLIYTHHAVSFAHDLDVGGLSGTPTRGRGCRRRGRGHHIRDQHVVVLLGVRAVGDPVGGDGRRGRLLCWTRGSGGCAWDFGVFFGGVGGGLVARCRSRVGLKGPAWVTTRASVPHLRGGSGTRNRRLVGQDPPYNCLAFGCGVRIRQVLRGAACSRYNECSGCI